MADWGRSVVTWFILLKDESNEEEEEEEEGVVRYVMRLVMVMIQQNEREIKTSLEGGCIDLGASPVPS